MKFRVYAGLAEKGLKRMPITSFVSEDAAYEYGYDAAVAVYQAHSDKEVAPDSEMCRKFYRELFNTEPSEAELEDFYWGEVEDRINFTVVPME